MTYYTIYSLIKKEIISIILIGDSMIYKLIGKVNGIFNKITLIELIISGCYIILGLIFFLAPNISNILVSVLTGLFLISNGVSSIFSYFKRGSILLFNNNLFYGIALVIIGILALFLGHILSIILGIYLIIVSIQKLNYGILLKKFNEPSWLITASTGVLYLVIAVISFFSNSETIIEVTGIILLGVGLINFVDTLLLRKRSEFFIA